MPRALDELVQFPRWVNWTWRERNGERTKVPINPVSGANASSTDPATWATYQLAAARSSQIGFVLGPPFAGVDLDGCRDPETGAIAPAAQKIIDRFGTYTEVSPSGTGVKLWLRGALPKGSRSSRYYDWANDRTCSKGGAKSKIEVFDHARYFVFTGLQLEGAPETIEDCQPQLEELLSRLFPPRPASNALPVTSSVLTEDDVYARIDKAKNRAKVRALASGDWSRYGTQSEGDMAYAQLLAYFCDCDAGLMERMFRSSSLWTEERQKQKGRDYIARTIAKAIERQGPRYRPPVPRRPSNAENRRADADDASFRGARTHRPRSGDTPTSPKTGDVGQEQEQQQQPRSELEQLNTLIARVFRCPDLEFLDEWQWQGDSIRAHTSRGSIEWPSTGELAEFRVSKAIVAGATGEYLVGPDTKPQKAWDHVARLIVKHAWRNRTAVEDVAAEEVGDAITLSWNRSKCPVAWSTEEVIRYVEQCSKPRDAWSDPPPCVFVGEGYVYLLPGDLKRWYSLPNAGGRDIPWVTMRRGLKQLGFEQHNLCRRDDGRRCDRRAWRALVHGPAGELVKRYVDDEGSAS